MWVKQLGKVLFDTVSKRDDQPRERRLHTPQLPGDVAALMAKGHDQIRAATAARLANGDREAAERILADEL
jgi:hypothetical protein